MQSRIDFYQFSVCCFCWCVPIALLFRMVILNRIDFHAPAHDSVAYREGDVVDKHLGGICDCVAVCFHVSLVAGGFGSRRCPYNIGRAHHVKPLLIHNPNFFLLITCGKVGIEDAGGNCTYTYYLRKGPPPKVIRVRTI